MVLITSIGVSQTRKITGTVVDDSDGSTLPGVSVILKGTTKGTVTDMNGAYEIEVPSKGGILLFSFVGFETHEEKVTISNVINVRMKLSVTQLNEVVVTGLGISREQKTLGYSTTTIKKGKGGRKGRV